jgi:hypothetical protein
MVFRGREDVSATTYRVQYSRGRGHLGFGSKTKGGNLDSRQVDYWGEAPGQTKSSPFILGAKSTSPSQKPPAERIAHALEPLDLGKIFSGSEQVPAKVLPFSAHNSWVRRANRASPPWLAQTPTLLLLASWGRTGSRGSDFPAAGSKSPLCFIIAKYLA